MIRAVLHAAVRAFERRYDYDAAYLHDIADRDPRGLWRFARCTRAGEYDGGLPREAIAAARLAAALHEDCGPCVQVVVDIALEAGVPASVLAALARGEPAAAGEDAALAFAFARAVLDGDTGLDALRASVERRFGPRGPWCLALALSVARMYPVIKRATGHARACARLEVAGTTVVPAARSAAHG